MEPLRFKAWDDEIGGQFLANLSLLAATLDQGGRQARCVLFQALLYAEVH